MDGDTEKITRKAFELALSGNTVALRLCLERILSPRKSRPVNISLPETQTADGMAEAQAPVVQAIAEGEFAPDEGTDIANILEARRKAIETQDQESRISVLESTRSKNVAHERRLKKLEQENKHRSTKYPLLIEKYSGQALEEAKAETVLSETDETEYHIVFIPKEDAATF